MIRRSMPNVSGSTCLPRMRGDDPLYESELLKYDPFAPHARG